MFFQAITPWMKITDKDLKEIISSFPMRYMATGDHEEGQASKGVMYWYDLKEDCFRYDISHATKDIAGNVYVWELLPVKKGSVWIPTMKCGQIYVGSPVSDVVITAEILDRKACRHKTFSILKT